MHDGSDDWKLLGEGEFSGDKIYEKNSAKPTMKDLNKAYKTRMAELDKQMPTMSPMHRRMKGEWGEW